MPAESDRRSTAIQAEVVATFRECSRSLGEDTEQPLRLLKRAPGCCFAAANAAAIALRALRPNGGTPTGYGYVFARSDVHFFYFPAYGDSDTRWMML